MAQGETYQRGSIPSPSFEPLRSLADKAHPPSWAPPNYARGLQLAAELLAQPQRESGMERGQEKSRTDRRFPLGVVPQPAGDQAQAPTGGGKKGSLGRGWNIWHQGRNRSDSSTLS
jgi:hypothetical protein